MKSSFSIPAGALSDRIPRMWVVAGGWCVYAACYAAFGVSAGLALLAAALLLLLRPGKYERIR